MRNPLEILLIQLIDEGGGYKVIPWELMLTQTSKIKIHEMSS
jgi:hypothetical protein